MPKICRNFIWWRFAKIFSLSHELRQFDSYLYHFNQSLILPKNVNWVNPIWYLYDFLSIYVSSASDSIPPFFIPNWAIPIWHSLLILFPLRYTIIKFKLTVVELIRPYFNFIFILFLIYLSLMVFSHWFYSRKTDSPSGIETIRLWFQFN